MTVPNASLLWAMDYSDESTAKMARSAIPIFGQRIAACAYRVDKSGRPSAACLHERQSASRRSSSQHQSWMHVRIDQLVAVPYASDDNDGGPSVVVHGVH